MATILNETPHAGGFLISEWDPDFSREQVNIYSGTPSVRVGTLAAQRSADNEYINYAPGAAAGAGGTLAGIFYDTYYGTNPAIGTPPGKGVIVARDAVVNLDEIDWNGQTPGQITASIAALKALGIVGRDGV